MTSWGCWMRHNTSYMFSVWVCIRHATHCTTYFPMGFTLTPRFRLAVGFRRLRLSKRGRAVLPASMHFRSSAPCGPSAPRFPCSRKPPTFSRALCGSNRLRMTFFSIYDAGERLHTYNSAQHVSCGPMCTVLHRFSKLICRYKTWHTPQNSSDVLENSVRLTQSSL